ncbi:PepSY domain-containing protein [Novosphingobium lentum]|uniref:PepSY domain-containing protein n=1 Tax=Novosphingobium lentum TaxID=145287 RepID=UPI000A95FD1F|nr:PepSY domain-containing protein [Novosphingobium lentum]
MRNYLIALAATTLVASGAQAAPRHMAGSELMSTAKVSLATARATALHARPGRITDQELEKEAGGTGLRYSFDVVSHGKTYEVGVDATTGRVLENQAEGAHPE